MQGGDYAGWGVFICPEHPTGSHLTSATTSSEPVSLQHRALPLHTTQPRPRVAASLLGLTAAGKAFYPIHVQEHPPGLPFLCRSGKQDVFFIFSLSTRAESWTRWAQRVDAGNIHPTVTVCHPLASEASSGAGSLGPVLAVTFYQPHLHLAMLDGPNS